MKRGRHRLKRATKLLISAGFCAVVLVWNLVRRIAGKKPNPECVILYYHAVPAEQRQLFAKQMGTLLRFAKPIRVDMDSSLDRGTRYCGVTFDDGFQSVVENALPELEKRNIPATLFVTTGYLGRYPEWWLKCAYYERHDKIASADQLQQLPANLISIGSHTVTHPMLPSLSEVEARRQLCASRAKLEGLLKRRITLFSFPFGAFNQKLIDWCREAGYERVFTTLPVIALRNPGEFITGRVATDPADWPLEFRLKLLGAYRWLPYAFSFKWRVLSNALVSKIRGLPTRIVRRAVARQQQESRRRSLVHRSQTKF